MKSPRDIVRGRIVDYDDKNGEVIIRAKYTDLYTFLKRGYTECNIEMIDSRPLSERQRKCCYTLIRAVAEHTGQGESSTKEWLKRRFLEDELHENPEETFSMSDAPMSLIAAFQKWLVKFVISEDIPCDFPLMNYVDDVPDYLYACLLNKKCCICGKPADLHHVKAIGRGVDREDVVHIGMPVYPLCRVHHNEAHNSGKFSFKDKYHLTDGVILDEALCKIYGLKYKEEDE